MCDTFLQTAESLSINNLLNCVKILSSTSLSSPAAALILKRVANPYYIKTLL